jgi:sigma-B regulation protein RsbU (phosphoserine phosphatase)
MPAIEAQHEVRCLEVWGGTESAESSLNLPGVDAWVFSKPYEDAAQGGDIYYVSSCFTGRVSRFAVADVSGHGSAVSTIAATLRKLMRKHINYLDQTGFAQVLNKEFAEVAQDGIFATAVMLSYFAPTDHLIVCNAGHPRPLWYDASEKTWRWLDAELKPPGDAPHNLPLGLIDPTAYVQFAVKLSPDDLVLIYTDSLTEARAGSDGVLLGEAGLIKMVRDLPVTQPQSFGKALLDRIATYRNHATADDDQTLIVLHHNATEVPSRPIRNSIRYIASMLGLAGD